MAAHNSFVVIDLEHIALGKGKVGPIIQVGLVKMDGVTGEELGRDEWFINSGGVPCNEFTTQITGITQAHIDSGLPLVRVANLIKTKYGTNTTYYAWGGDCARLNRDSQKLKGCAPIQYMIDFQNMYQTFVPGSNAIGLKRAMADNGLEFVGTHHTAADDAYNTGRLIHKVMGRATMNTLHADPVNK